MVKKIFKWVIKEGKVTLLEPKCPKEVEESHKLDYCKYHHMLGHVVEDCWVFKDIIERMIQEGELKVKESARQEPPKPHEKPNKSSNYMTVNMVNILGLFADDGVDGCYSEEDICSMPNKPRKTSR